jgi:hypothetical protein
MSGEQLERLLANATLKPRNEIDVARDAFELQTVPIQAHNQGNEHEDFPNF